MFELTKEEYDSLRSQIVILKNGTGSHSKYLPFAFTEQGIAMLSSVLKSKKALQVNILIMRAFVMIRQYYMDSKELKQHIERLENEMNTKFKDIHEALNFLLSPERPERKQIGFKRTENNQRATLRKDLQEKRESGIPHFSVIPAPAPTVFF
jgi:hypothetical protein